MCDIVTGLMVAGTAVKAIGGVKTANANAANAAYQREVALMNAGFINEQILDAADRGAESERQVRSEGAQVVSTQRATLAASGIDLSFGSPLDFVVGTAAEVEMDAFRSQQNTAREIQDLEQDRYNVLAEAGALGAAATNYRTGGLIGAVGTALTGGADVFKYRATL